MITQTAPTATTTLTSFSVSDPTLNFHQCDIQKILNNLYISDEFASRNKSLLQDLSVKHIVVVGHELTVSHEDLFNYLHIAVRDSKRELISQYFEKTNKFIQEALKKKETVLVHCAKGKSRSATIIIAYLMFKHKMQYQEAITFVKRKRREISPNEGFIHQLKKYEKVLQTQQIEA